MLQIIQKKTDSNPSDDTMGALIAHLSAEAQTQMTNAIRWRTSAAFSTWAAPFIVVGGASLSRSEFVDVSNLLDKWPLLTLLGLIYVGMGFIAAIVERHSWRRVNLLREAIISLSLKDTDQSSEITKRLFDAKSPSKVILGYLLLFSAISVALLLLVVIVVY